MTILTEMAISYLVLLVVVGFFWVMATMAYATVPRRNTHINRSTCISQYPKGTTEMDYTISDFFVAKYRTQAAVSGHYQAAKNLRKQGVPLEMAVLILFGDRRDCAA